MLILFFRESTAQAKLDEVRGQIRMGVGVSNKSATMFGTPIFLSADITVSFTNRWQFTAEGGGVAFRDQEYPTQQIGFFGGYSRYQHNYGGLRIGRNLLDTAQASQLILSSGADYLAIIEPNVKLSAGLLSGYSYHYELKRYVNVPIQVDYTPGPFTTRHLRVSFSGRWNFNSYHSFPTFSLGISIPIYERRWYTYTRKAR